MHFYQSGSPKNDEYQAVEDRLVSHRLFSMHGAYKRSVLKWASEVHARKERPKCIMLDSGAFTAWNKGHDTTVDEVIASYDSFMQVAGDLFDEVWMINLDKIPGSKGVDPTPEQIAEAVVISDRNFEILTKRFGERILPVFHQGEESSRLHEIMVQSKYICVSPRNDLPEGARVRWSLEAHGECRGWNTHGLATTGNNMLKVVPWYSVDSAAWVLHAAYGIVDIFFGERYKGVFFSEDAGKQKEIDIHFNTVPSAMQDKILECVKEYGFTVEEIKTVNRVRELINLGELQKYATHAKASAKDLYQPSLFGL